MKKHECEKGAEDKQEIMKEVKLNSLCQTRLISVPLFLWGEVVSLLLSLNSFHVTALCRWGKAHDSSQSYNIGTDHTDVKAVSTCLVLLTMSQAGAKSI